MTPTGMSQRAQLEAALKRHFGHDQFKPGQRQVIEYLVAGQSAAAVFPTGGGKSVCYQLPALLMNGLTVVVSPLIALMKDQIDALTARGIAAARLDSTLNLDEYRLTMDQVLRGQLRLLYIAPERFANERFREAIRRVRVSLFAVDEAHCISEWGHNFRPDYLKLVRFVKLCGAQCTLALTATATEKVLADICRRFQIAPDCAIRTGFHRPNLKLLTTAVAQNDRDAELLEQLNRRPAGPTIVYVTLQRTAEILAQMLVDAGLPARPYHAGLDNERRAAVQDWFIASDRGVVVATIAFGMGIDKANIRYVYHYNIPKSLENYSQEIGRAGRDGEEAICQMFVCPDDRNVLENFVYGDTPAAEAVQCLVHEIFSLGEAFDVSIHELSSAHDIRTLVVRTLMTYLELLGHLEGGTPFYCSYQFKPLASSAQILSNFHGERRAFLARLFAAASKAKTWFRIDVEQAASQIGADRQRIIGALDYLDQQQMLEVKSSGVRYRYRVLEPPADLDSLAQSLHQRTVDREFREIGRLRQVLELARQESCQVASLCAHFAEKLERPCGHCSRCLDNGKAIPLPDRERPTVDEGVWEKAAVLRREHPEVLGEVRSLTRLLCGVSSPKLTRAKLTSDRLFGALGHVPFTEVMARASAIECRDIDKRASSAAGA